MEKTIQVGDSCKMQVQQRRMKLLDLNTGVNICQKTSVVSNNGKC